MQARAFERYIHISTQLACKCTYWEHSGFVVECLTRDREAAGLISPASLCCVLEKNTFSLLSTGSTQEVPSQHN